MELSWKSLAGALPPSRGRGQPTDAEMGSPLHHDSGSMQVKGKFQIVLEDLGRLHEEEVSNLRSMVKQLESQLGLSHFTRSELPGQLAPLNWQFGHEHKTDEHTVEPHSTHERSFGEQGSLSKKFKGRPHKHPVKSMQPQVREQFQQDVQGQPMRDARYIKSVDSIESCAYRVNPARHGSDLSEASPLGAASHAASVEQDLMQHANGGHRGRMPETDKSVQFVDDIDKLSYDRKSIEAIEEQPITLSTTKTGGKKSRTSAGESPAQSIVPVEAGKSLRPASQFLKPGSRHAQTLDLTGEDGGTESCRSVSARNVSARSLSARSLVISDSSATATRFVDFWNHAEKSVKSGPVSHWERLVKELTHQAVLNTTNALLEIWVRTDTWVRQIRWNNPGVDLWESAQKQDRKRGGHQKREELKGNDRIDMDLVEDQTSLMFHKSLLKSLKERTLLSFVENNIVLDPQSKVRVSWALIGVLLMLYDLIFMPMQAFDLPEHGFTTFVAYFAQIFWTADIVLAFFTGVYINTELVKKLAAIAKSYAKGWLLFDLLVVGPLWVVMLLGADSSTMNSLQAFKYVRMLRFLRLLRLAKFSRMLGEALASINSPVIMLVLGMVKLMGGMAVLSHVNACLWYAAGRASRSGWTEDYVRDSVLYQYLAAMHWALTQFQGTSEIVPGGSTGERAYAVVTVLFSMLILSTFVSSLTNMMMQLQALSDERTWQHRAVKGYLHNNSISHALSRRVKKYIQWKQQFDRDHSEDDEVLKMMPLQLMMDLQDEVLGPVLVQHRYFRMFRFVYPRLTRRVCHLAVQQLHPAPDELIFSAQESSFCMYFVRRGQLRYTIVRRKLCSTPIRMPDQNVNEGMYLSEAALWMHWQHRGNLVVANFASLLTVVAQQFQNLVSTHPPALASCMLYARRYIQAINMVEWHEISDCVRPEQLISHQDGRDSEISLTKPG